MFANWQSPIICPEEAHIFKYTAERAVKTLDVTASSARWCYHCLSRQMDVDDDDQENVKS